MRRVEGGTRATRKLVPPKTGRRNPPKTRAFELHLHMHIWGFVSWFLGKVLARVRSYGTRGMSTVSVFEIPLLFFCRVGGCGVADAPFSDMHFQRPDRTLA